MENLSELIKKEIRAQYGSVKEFSNQTRIPLGTLNSAIAKGFGGSAFDMVIRICRILSIRQVFDDEINQVSGPFYETVKKLESLDQQGLATVNAIINVEVERCAEKTKGKTAETGTELKTDKRKKEGKHTKKGTEEESKKEKEKTIKSYNGMGYVRNDEHIKELIREVLNERK